MSLTAVETLSMIYAMTVDIALKEVTERGRCDTLLLAVAPSEFNPPEVYKFDLLDARLHLYVMQAATRQQPEIEGFVFVSMGTVMLPVDDHTHAAHAGLLTVWCTREAVVAQARLIESDPIKGRQILDPVWAPAGVVEHYRKVFTDEALPPGYYPMS